MAESTKRSGKDEVFCCGVLDVQTKCNQALALVVCHGMGQQVPYQTSGAIADLLTSRAPRLKNGLTVKVQARRARRVTRSDGKLPRLTRAEFDLQYSQNGQIVACLPVHVYEVYWSPLTEGAIRVYEVVLFLVRAACSGIGQASWKYWAFGEDQKQDVSLGARGGLILALLVLLGLLAGPLAAVAALFFKLVPSLADTGVQLGRDLCAWLIGIALAFPALSPALMRLLFRRCNFRRPAGFDTFSRTLLIGGTAFATTVGVFLLLTALQPLLTIYLAAALVPERCKQLRFGGAFCVAFGLLLLLGFRRRPRWWEWLLQLLCLGGLCCFWGTAADSGIVSADSANALARLAPLMTLGFGAILSWFLVTYLGDVAIYVSSHEVNRWSEIREKIQATSLHVFESVYAAYSSVILAGHSLGSVVAYDSLNNLLLQQPGADQLSACVAQTRLLVTYGSPLDKTAFLFRMQTRDSTFRELMAGSRQPLLLDRANLPPWVNIWSKDDPVSGELNHFDPTKSGSTSGAPPSRAVENKEEKRCGPLLAHVQYEEGEELFRALHEGIRAVALSARPAASADGAETSVLPETGAKC